MRRPKIISNRITIAFVASIFLFGVAVPLLPAATATTSPLAGIVVPLYAYPTSSSWSLLVQLKVAHPAVHIIAVVNPADGAGSSKDSNFVSGIRSLQSHGIVVLGYVYTSYGARSLALLKKQMANWKNWYGVNGIFFDEMSALGTKAGYYIQLANYARSLHFGMTMGNPGSRVDASLVGIFSKIMIYESPGMPGTSSISGYSGKDRISYVAYGVRSLPSLAQIQSTTAYAGYLYITSLAGPNRYFGLPPYLSQEIAMLTA